MTLKVNCARLNEALKSIKAKGFPKRSRNAYKIVKRALGEEVKDESK